MIIGPDFTNAANEDHFDEIDALLRSAFDNDLEAKLVRQLRSDGDIIGEMIKPWNGTIAAYAALSKMRKPIGWACLAPVAVLPEYQNGSQAPDISLKPHYSFGTRLVQEIAQIVYLAGKNKMREVPDTIVVLGRPNFYLRAGFSSERARALKTPYAVEHTLIARPGDDLPEEELIYPSAFEKILHYCQFR